MLFVPEEIQKRLRSLSEQAKASSDRVAVARRMLEVWPEWPQAWVVIAAASADGTEKEAADWDAVELGPRRTEWYLALAEFLPSRNADDVLAKRLRHLGLWKLALADEIHAGTAGIFKGILGDGAAEPESYERLARLADKDMEG